MQNRYDICESALLSPFELILTYTVPVQNYITAIVVFLIVEQLMTWGFYGKFTAVTLFVFLV